MSTGGASGVWPPWLRSDKYPQRLFEQGGQVAQECRAGRSVEPPMIYGQNPSSLIDSSGSSARSVGMGNACSTVPRLTTRAPNRSDNRFNKTIPDQGSPVGTRSN